MDRQALLLLGSWGNAARPQAPCGGAACESGGCVFSCRCKRAKEIPLCVQRGMQGLLNQVLLFLPEHQRMHGNKA